jgi:hypothetical protein
VHTPQTGATNHRRRRIGTNPDTPTEPANTGRHPECNHTTGNHTDTNETHDQTGTVKNDGRYRLASLNATGFMSHALFEIATIT